MGGAGQCRGCNAWRALLELYGEAWIDRQLPRLAASKHWHYFVNWAGSYGFLTLAAVAALPFAQTPALIGAATERATRVDAPPVGGDAMATQGNERGGSR